MPRLVCSVSNLTINDAGNYLINKIENLTINDIINYLIIKVVNLTINDATNDSNGGTMSDVKVQFVGNSAGISHQNLLSGPIIWIRNE